MRGEHVVSRYLNRGNVAHLALRHVASANRRGIRMDTELCRKKREKKRRIY